MTNSLKVAAIDFVPAWGDLQGNIDRLAAVIPTLAEEEITYAVFPETALSGYLFNDFIEIEPYLDTIPGKMTERILPLLKTHNIYMSVGIAERDAATGLAYNSAVLMGPEGIIGVYRKNGLNPQDQKIFAPGNLGIPVFETPIGKIALLICYDDTYWQYARIAMLKGAEIIGWHSVSDRIMPNAPANEKRGDHSTVSHVQYMSAYNGVWTICATRSGIETNPLHKTQLYYNGGSSIWSPEGHRVAGAPVIPPVEIAPGLNGIYSAEIDLTESARLREYHLQRRRPSLYHPYLALHRSPTDQNATTVTTPVNLVAAQWPLGENHLDAITVTEGTLSVLPELTTVTGNDDVAAILAKAENQGGEFEQTLCSLARKGGGYLVGSYPEIKDDRIYHTVSLAGPEGTILGRYRATHLNERDQNWASCGEEVIVVPTPIGRIGLALASELSVAEFAGMFSALRADIIAAPNGQPSPLKVEIDAKLFSVPNPPTGIADFYPYAAATTNQLWVVCGGRAMGAFSGAGIYGPEPIVLTPTLTPKLGALEVRLETTLPAPYTWINQAQLIQGQVPIWFQPLVQ